MVIPDIWCNLEAADVTLMNLERSENRGMITEFMESQILSYQCVEGPLAIVPLEATLPAAFIQAG